MYHVLDRDEEDEDDNDEKGVRVYGSRTEFGTINAIAEKRPWLAEPRRFFLGLVSVRFYDYLWGFTAAQVELMMADLPLVVYPKSTDGKKKRPRRRTATEKADYERRCREYMDKMNEKPKPFDFRRYKVMGTNIGE